MKVFILTPLQAKFENFESCKGNSLKIDFYAKRNV